MNILVTGGAGFIGSHTLIELVGGRPRSRCGGQPLQFLPQGH